jgi:DNA polymerase II small subunit/DNA polymerase delta subunit B
MELINLISINKVSQKTKKFSIVALVKEKNEKENTILVEDLTGNISLEGLKEETFGQIVVDDVAGLVCEKNEEKILVNSVIWPDVPIKREIINSKSEINCLFLPNFINYEKIFEQPQIQKISNLLIFVVCGLNCDNEKLQELNVNLVKDSNKIFVFDEGKPHENITSLQNPTLIQIEQVKIFLINGQLYSNLMERYNLKQEDLVINLLRKRHMSPTLTLNNKNYANDPFLLEAVPDIIIIANFGKPLSINYKGTTIIQCGNKSESVVGWLVNLKTRETIRIDMV